MKINILLNLALTSVFLSCPALGCYGDPVALTPNLDRLASEGLRYTRAFSVHGVCAPSRHALITGMNAAIRHTGNTAGLVSRFSRSLIFL